MAEVVATKEEREVGAGEDEACCATMMSERSTIRTNAVYDGGLDKTITPNARNQTNGTVARKYYAGGDEVNRGNNGNVSDWLQEDSRGFLRNI